MSLIHVKMSFDVKNLSSSEHSVLNVLAFRAHDNNECWTSVKLLCEYTSLDKKTVYKVLSSLSSKRIIQKTGKIIPSAEYVYKLNLKGTNNCFFINKIKYEIG